MPGCSEDCPFRSESFRPHPLPRRLPFNQAPSARSKPPPNSRPTPAQLPPSHRRWPILPPLFTKRCPLFKLRPWITPPNSRRPVWPRAPDPFFSIGLSVLICPPTSSPQYGSSLPTTLQAQTTPLASKPVERVILRLRGVVLPSSRPGSAPSANNPSRPTQTHAHTPDPHIHPCCFSDCYGCHSQFQASHPRRPTDPHQLCDSRANQRS